MWIMVTAPGGDINQRHTTQHFTHSGLLTQQGVIGVIWFDDRQLSYKEDLCKSHLGHDPRSSSEIIFTLYLNKLAKISLYLFCSFCSQRM